MNASRPSEDDLAVVPAQPQSGAQSRERERAPASIAQLRGTEFARLDARDEVYLDYTGSALYLESHVRWHAELLCDGVFGNPHAASGASLAATRWADAARAAVLALFDADPALYDVVFTPNATGAAKLVGEAFPFRRGSRLVLSADNHNSILGIRQFAWSAGARVYYVPLTRELKVADGGPGPRRAPIEPSLFAFPAQSNFSGVRHPLGLVREAQALGYRVLLDAAAFVPSSPLSLRQVPADYVILSLYKLLGYPTGVGALVVRSDALSVLRRPWFAGGTIEFSSVQNGIHLQRAGAAGFEDGTINFLALSAVPWGLEYLRRLGMTRVRDHVRQLTSALLSGMTALRHRNGRPMMTIYGAANDERRGGTVAFNLKDEHGRWIPHGLVEQRIAQDRISLRSGCFCNPGVAEAAFGFDARRAALCVDRSRKASPTSEFSITKFGSCMGSVPVGAVRASVGLATNARDIARLLDALDEWRG